MDPKDIIARIDKAIGEAPASPRAAKSAGDTSNGNAPPEGLFNKDPNQIAQAIMRTAKSKGDALARLAVYVRGAGNNLSQDQRHAIGAAKAAIKASAMAEESFDLDEAASFYPDAAAIIHDAGRYHSDHYFASDDEEWALNIARTTAMGTGIPYVVVWCPEFGEYRLGPTDDIDVLTVGSTDFDILAAYDEDGDLGPLTDDDIMGDDSEDAPEGADADELGAEGALSGEDDALDAQADVEIDATVCDPDGDGDNDCDPDHDHDHDFYAETLGERRVKRLSKAAIRARMKSRKRRKPATFSRRRAARRKAMWRKRHASKIKAYNRRYRAPREDAAAVAAEIEEMHVKRRKLASRLSANRTAAKIKTPTRRKAASREKVWRLKNRHHLKRYHGKYKGPARKVPGKKSESVVERIDAALAPRPLSEAFDPNYAKVGDVKGGPGPFIGMDSERREITKIEARDGYVLRTEKISWQATAGSEVNSFDMTSALTPEGLYIGDERAAKALVDKLGIKPELAKVTDNVCCIGKSSKDGKWYGWSHRAIHGFAIGDKTLEVFPGESKGGRPIATEDEARAAAIAFADSVS